MTGSHDRFRLAVCAAYGVFTALVAFACLPANGANPAPSVPAGALDDTVTVGLGQTVASSDGRLTVTFIRVEADSRCAVNVVCVWAGDAAVRIKAGGESLGAVEGTIHSGLEPRLLTLDGYRVSYVDLRPHPGASDASTAPSLILRITR